MIRLVDETGRTLATHEGSSVPIMVGTVVALDASDVLMEVVAIRQRSPDLEVEIRVTDDRTLYGNVDRLAATTPPMTQLVSSEDGVRLALHTFSGSGPPLIVCHATGFHSHAYAPMVRRLVSRYSVYGIDFRCHGDSASDGPRMRSWRDLVPDLRTAVAHVRARVPVGTPIRAFGHSMGGTAILATQLADPGTFSSAIVYEPVVIPSELAGSGPPGLAVGARRRQSVFASRAEARSRYAASGTFSSFRSDALAAYVQHGFERVESGQGGRAEFRLRCSPEDEASFYEGSDPLLVEEVSELQLPLAVVVGGDHSGVPAKATSAIAKLFDLELISLADLGHLGPFEDPDLVAQTVIDARATSIGPPAGR